MEQRQKSMAQVHVLRLVFITEAAPSAGLRPILARYPATTTGQAIQLLTPNVLKAMEYFASDSGMVIYAGPISGGYGNMVAVDHGNGYVSLYAHLNSWNVSCGQPVNKGQAVGACGSSGNSTGAHLHFEIRQNGGFLNPWQVLQ